MFDIIVVVSNDLDDYIIKRRVQREIANWEWHELLVLQSLIPVEHLPQQGYTS